MLRLFLKGLTALKTSIISETEVQVQNRVSSLGIQSGVITNQADMQLSAKVPLAHE